MKRIAITGRPGVGKSTVFRNIVEHLTCTYGGMVSADIRVEGERVGFGIMDISTKEEGILAHKDGRGPSVGKYYVNLDDLKNIGINSIKNALSCDLVVIDEIAPMENGCKDFAPAFHERGRICNAAAWIIISFSTGQNHA